MVLHLRATMPVPVFATSSNKSAHCMSDVVLFCVMPIVAGAVAAETPRAHAQNRVCFGNVHPGSPGVEQGVSRGHVWVDRVLLLP